MTKNYLQVIFINNWKSFLKNCSSVGLNLLKNPRIWSYLYAWCLCVLRSVPAFIVKQHTQLPKCSLKLFTHNSAKKTKKKKSAEADHRYPACSNVFSHWLLRVAFETMGSVGWSFRMVRNWCLWVTDIPGYRAVCNQLRTSLFTGKKVFWFRRKCMKIKREVVWTKLFLN